MFFSVSVSLTKKNQSKQVSQLKRLLSYPFVATKKLQSEDLTPGTFLFEWKRLLSQINANISIANDTAFSTTKKRICFTGQQNPVSCCLH